MEFSVGIYTNSLSVIILPIRSRTKTFIEKTLVGNFWFVGESVVNKFTDGFTD
jgi:hypothetical protein